MALLERWDFAVQLASHHFGAEVTGVCSGTNLELVKSLGAIRSLITPRRILPKAVRPTMLFLTRLASFHLHKEKGSQEDGSLFNVHTASDGADKIENLIFLKELIEAGKIKPVIDRRLSIGTNGRGAPLCRKRA